MKQVGVNVKGVVLDSMIAAFLLDASRSQYGIDPLAEAVLKFRKIPTVDLIGRGKSQVSMVKCSLDKVAVYASEDADIAMRLAERFDAELKKLPAVQRLNDD